MIDWLIDWLTDELSWGGIIDIVHHQWYFGGKRGDSGKAYSVFNIPACCFIRLQIFGVVFVIIPQSNEDTIDSWITRKSKVAENSLFLTANHFSLSRLRIQQPKGEEWQRSYKNKELLKPRRWNRIPSRPFRKRNPMMRTKRTMDIIIITIILKSFTSIRDQDNVKSGENVRLLEETLVSNEFIMSEVHSHIPFYHHFVPSMDACKKWFLDPVSTLETSKTRFFLCFSPSTSSHQL